MVVAKTHMHNKTSLDTSRPCICGTSIVVKYTGVY